MKVVKVNPRGFCHGVVYAMNLVAKTIEDPETIKPIYIIGEIVHNRSVTEAFAKHGVITLNGKNRAEILKKVDLGTVIITAHGIDPNLIIEAKKRNLNVVDATCSDVYKTHQIISESIANDFEVIFIGKKGHPEPEGVLGIDPTKIHLVETTEDIANLELDTTKIIVTNQTTMSLWDVQELIASISAKFPDAQIIDEICDATRMRQEAVFEAAKYSDLMIVVGDPNSNNTNKLVEIVETKVGISAYRINNVQELDIEILLNDEIDVIAVSSGASTPSLMTKEVIEYIESFDKQDQNTWSKPKPTDLKRLVPRVRK